MVSPRDDWGSGENKVMAGEVKRYLDKLKPAQDELGAYVDLVVSSQMARDAAVGGDAPQWFNAGWLVAQLRDSVERCQRALDRAAKAKPFWRR